MSLDTLTHARLRVAQGDLIGARRVLEEMLRRRPGDDDARSLLSELDTLDVTTTGDEHDEPAATPPVAGDARELAARFRAVLGGPRPEPPVRARIRRLEAWLGRVTRSSSDGR